jgi:hypothetical protein
VLLSIILGGLLGIGVAFVKAFFDGADARAEEKAKLSEIKTTFIPKRWRQGA